MGSTTAAVGATTGVVALVLALACCGAPAEPTPDRSPLPEASPTPSATTAPTPRPTPTPRTAVRDEGVPPFPAGTRSQLVEPAPRSRLELSDARAGHHDGFDRVVLELRGRGVPGWYAAYVARPRADGSGTRVPVAGDAYLDVYASGTTYDDPDDLAYDYEHRRHVAVPGDGPVRDVYVLGTFEGYTQVMVGVSGAAAPFRVFRLVDPPRVVVDVRDTGS